MVNLPGGKQLFLAIHNLQFGARPGVIQRQRTSQGQAQEDPKEVEHGETVNRVEKYPQPSEEEWKQKMGTKEGIEELRSQAEVTAGTCPICKNKHKYERKLPGGISRGQITGYKCAKPSKP